MDVQLREPLIIDLTVYLDDRGSLYEVVHSFELPQTVKAVGIPGSPQPLVYGWARFGQVYMVNSPCRGTIRAFHRHQILWDYFCVVHGRAKFVIVKTTPFEQEWETWNRGITPTMETLIPEYLEIQKTLTVEKSWTFTLGTEKPQLLVVPPMLWHGWEALVDNAVLLCVGTEVYNRNEPDEQRVSCDAFGGDYWGIKAR